MWVCRTQEELDAALVAAQALGQPFHIEELLEGPELSVFAIAAGETAVAFPPARDYKRLGDGDTGPNTGGMGSFSPLPDVPDSEAAGDPRRDPPACPERARAARLAVPGPPVRAG